MSKPPDADEPETSSEYKYDLAQAERILKEMAVLRGAAQNARDYEIVTMIDASLNVLVTAYEAILRYRKTRLPGDGMVQ